MTPEEIAKEQERIAKILFESSNGYCKSLQDLTECIKAIPFDKLKDFIYTMQRIAEKQGYEGFYIDAHVEEEQGD